MCGDGLNAAQKVFNKLLATGTFYYVFFSNI